MQQCPSCHIERKFPSEFSRQVGSLSRRLPLCLYCAICYDDEGTRTSAELLLQRGYKEVFDNMAQSLNLDGRHLQVALREATKTCRTCERTKGLNEFELNRLVLCGIDPDCMACQTARATRYNQSHQGR